MNSIGVAVFVIVFTGSFIAECSLSIAENEVLDSFSQRCSAFENRQISSIEDYCLYSERNLRQIFPSFASEHEVTSMLSKLIRCGVYSEIPFEEKVYNLLTESEKQQDSTLEDACRFLLGLEYSFFGSINSEHAEKIAAALIKKPSKINQPGMSGRTVLMIFSDAVQYRDYYTFKRIGRNPQEERETAEAHLITSVCQKLLAAGASLELADKQGLSPLHIAVGALNVPLTELFIERKADLGALDKEGCMPQHKLFIERSSSSWVDRFRSSHAARSPTEPAHRRENIVRTFLLAGAKLGAADNKRNTLLHLAVLANAYGIAELLLRKEEILLDMQTSLEQTALHVSSQNGNYDVTRLLLRDGARAEVQDCFGNFPIHYACLSEPCVKLFEGKIDLSKKNASGWQPIHIACYVGEIDNQSGLVYLLNHGNDVNARIFRFGKNGTPTWGKTGLMLACERGHLAVCRKLLMQSHIDLLIEDDIVGTAFDCACSCEHFDICSFLLENSKTETIKAKLLMSACQNVDKEVLALFFSKWKGGFTSQDGDGNTVLHIACLESFDDLVERLLQNFDSNSLGAAINNKKNLTPFECAHAKGNKGIVKIFKRHQIFS